MSKEKDNLQYNVLCEQGDLGLWETPLSKEDNEKVKTQNKKTDIEEDKSK